MKTIAIIFLLFASVLANNEMLKSKDYLNDVFDIIADELLAISGTALTLEGFEEDFNITWMGQTFNGLVKFHSGFVNRIGKFRLNEQKYRHIWLDTMV